MISYSVAHAKAHLSEIIHQVEGGEEVVITRHGSPVVRIVPSAVRRPLSSRAELRSRGPVLDLPSADVVRAERGSARY